MPLDFHRDMDKYLTNKRRKRVFSGIKSKVMNKKAVLSYHAANKFGGFKDKLVSKIADIKKNRYAVEKEITHDDIKDLVEKQGIERKSVEGIKPRVEAKPVPAEPSDSVVSDKGLEKEEQIGEGEGWEEIKLAKPQDKNVDLSSLEEAKRKIQENLAKMQEKEKAETGKLFKLVEEKENRDKAESEEDKLKRLELEDEIRVLKEKERIEEDRLMDLRRARRSEQIGALRGRVKDILFNKKPKKVKDMVEEVRKEVRREAKINDIERQKREAEAVKEPKEEVPVDKGKEEVNRIEVLSPISQAKLKTSKNPSGINEEAKGNQATENQKPEVKLKEEKVRPKKSFFSKFIQVRTAAQLAQEEEERLKSEEEDALRNQSNINNLFQQGESEVKTNIPSEEPTVNISTLFSDDDVQQEASDGGEVLQGGEDTINLGDDYKIKVVKN